MVNINITAEVGLGDKVYLVTDPDQEVHIVTSICVYIDGSIGYRLSKKMITDWFMAGEFSLEKDLTLNQ